MKPNPASPLMTTEPIIARGILTLARVVSSDMWTTPSTPSLESQLLRVDGVGTKVLVPARAKAGVKKPIQKLTPLLGQLRILISTCQAH